MSVYGAADELLGVVDTLGLIADPMFVIDDHGRIVFWNAPLQHLLGYTYDEVAGRTCGRVLAGSDIFGNRYCGESCPVVRAAQRGDTVRMFRLQFRAKGDGMVPVEVTVLRFYLPATKRLLLAHLVRPSAAPVDAPMEPARSRRDECHDVRVRELTEREVEILGMVAAGKNAPEIADVLCISRLTARNHIQHIFRKLEVHSKAEATAFAYRMRLV